MTKKTLYYSRPYKIIRDNTAMTMTKNILYKRLTLSPWLKHNSKHSLSDIEGKYESTNKN